MTPKPEQTWINWRKKPQSKSGANARKTGKPCQVRLNRADANKNGPRPADN